MLTAKIALPHRLYMVFREIRGVTGPTSHELMILAGLMGVRMIQKVYLKDTVFPVRISNTRSPVVRHSCYRSTVPWLVLFKDMCPAQ